MCAGSTHVRNALALHPQRETRIRALVLDGIISFVSLRRLIGSYEAAIHDELDLDLIRMIGIWRKSAAG